MILVFLAVAILLTFKRRLLGAKSSSVVADVLTQVIGRNTVVYNEFPFKGIIIMS